MRHAGRRICTRDRGLPELPRLVFFDTNVVQNLHSYGEFIYDNFLDPFLDSKMSTLGPRFRADIFALADFMALGRRNGWPIAVSPGILGELGAIQEPGKRSELVVWANELAHYYAQLRESRDAADESCYGEVERFTVAHRCWLSDRLAILPQESDRQLVIDALEHGCDVFLTMDYRTIWRHRDEVDRFGLRVMRPVELLEHVDP